MNSNTSTSGAETGEGARAPVDALAEGFGGRAVLLALTSYRVTASGARLLVGESLESTAGSELISSFDSTVTQDLVADRFRVDYARTIHYAADAILTYSEISNGEIGTVDGVDTLFGRSGVMSSARLASTRKHLRLLQPHLLVRQVVDDPTTATDTGVAQLNGVEHRLIEVADPTYPLTLWVDPTNGYLSQLTTMENHHVFRDVTLTVSYDDWSTAEGGLAYPTIVKMYKDGELIHEETRSAVEVNPTVAEGFFSFDETTAFPPVPELAAWAEASHQFHQEWSSFGFPIDFIDATVEARELSPGGHSARVWVLVSDDDDADAIMDRAVERGATELWRHHFWAEFNGFNNSFIDPWGNQIMLWTKPPTDPVEIPEGWTNE